MPVRKFEGAARVVCSPGLAGQKGAVSYIALAQLKNTGVGSFVSGAKAGGGSPGNFYDFQVEVSQLEIYKNGPSRGLTTVGLSGVWCVFAATKVSGKAKAQLHIYRLDTKVWQHGEGSTEIENPTENAEEIRLGQWGTGEQFEGLYAASAVWDKVLTQAEIEELANAGSITGWLAKSPVAMWTFNQASTATAVTDVTGNGANQTALLGTSVEAIEPPIPYVLPAVPLEPATGVGDGSLLLTAPTTITLEMSIGLSDALAAVSARTTIALGSAVSGSTPSLTLRVRQVMARVRVFENPPMRQYLVATVPGGKTYRWGEDEPSPDRAFEDLGDSDAVPGGYKELTGSVSRKPNVDYGDMQRGTRLELFGAGQLKLGEYRLQQAPRSAGDKLVMDPAAVGYQAHLADDESAQAIPIDADMTAWGEPSQRYRVLNPAVKANLNGQVQLLPAGDPEGGGVPAIAHSWTAIDNNNQTEIDYLGNWYDSGGVELGRAMMDFVNVRGLGPGDVNWSNIIGAGSSDTGTEALHDFNASTTSQKSVTVPAGRFFLEIYDAFTGLPLNGNFKSNWHVQWRNLRVFDRSGIPVVGTWPNVGVLASDVIAYAIGRWAPQLDYSTGTNGTIRPSQFPIPHLAFKEPTTVQEMINQANRFELTEWAVWHGSGGPTFYMNPRGEREGRKRWRARVRPTQLKETGPSMDRVFNGVIVQYQDVDGTTKIVGPPGSGFRQTNPALVDTDPLNPANQITGLRKWTKVAMTGIATVLGAVETGQRFLEQTKLLDGSGEATLNGYVEDEHGMSWPYYCVRSGDLIEFVDSSIRGDRYIVSAQRSRATRSVTISLDAPPDSMEALLERLGVRQLVAGLGG